MPEAVKPALERVSTGITGLDTVLEGGLIRGSAYIVHGPPGAGKTILASQICFHRAMRGEKALYVTLMSEGHGRLLQHLQSMTFFDPAAVSSHILYLSGYNALTAEGSDALLRMITAETRRYGARFVVLDGLFLVRAETASEQGFRTFVHDLQGLTALTGTTMLLLTNGSGATGGPEHTMTDGWIELRDDMVEARALRSLIVHKQRASGYLRGRHLFHIGGDGIKVHPRIEATLTRAPAASSTMRRISMGSHALDGMLFGGIPESSMTMVIGPSGSGKTTMGLRFLSESSPENPGLLFTFYETPTRLVAKARGIGVDLERLIDQGALDIIWQPLAENLVDELGHRLLDAVRVRGVRRLFIDAVNGIRSSMIFPKRLPLLLNALNNTLRGAEVTVLYALEMDDLSLPTTLRTDQLSAMVDNIIVLHLSWRHPTVRRNITILKVRDGDFDPISREFHIGAEGIGLGPHRAVRAWEEERSAPDESSAS